MKKISILWIGLVLSCALSAQPYSTYYYQRASLFDRLSTARGGVIFLGDSITDGCEWSELFGNSSVQNRGISGDVTQGVIDRLGDILRSRPDQLFLMIGINDLALGKSVDYVVDNIETIIRRVRQESPATHIYVQSLLPVNPDFDRFSGHVSKQQEILKVNRALAQLAGEGCTYVDLYPAFVSENDKLDPAYTNDGLHLTAAGYQLWADRIGRLVGSSDRLVRDAALEPQVAAAGSVRAPMRVADISVWSPTYPVLIGKAHNPVLRVRIDASGHERALTLQALTVDLTASDDLADIEAVQLFYTGDRAEFAADRAVGEEQAAQARVQLNGKVLLRPGSNYFWISYRLAESADLLHRLGAQFVAAAVDSQTVSIPYEVDYPRKRIGHALRQHGQDGIDTYRIPGLVTTNEGTLIAVYDNRRNGSVDLQADVDIGMNRSTDGGQSWSPMRVIMDRGEWGGKPQDQNGVGDPAILVDRQTNTIWVAALWAHGHPGERSWWASEPGLQPTVTNQLILAKSEDDGKTWSEPINITAQVKRPEWHLLLQGPGKGITMQDGTLVFPAQFKDENDVPHATIMYSRDRGKTWAIGTGAKSHTTEAQVVELADGSLMLNMRDDRGNGPGGRNGAGARSVAITRDLGATWTEHPTSRKALPEPVCMASLITHRLPDGENVLLFSNPAHRYVRENMTLQVSRDEGMTWPESHHLLLDQGRGRGYSCMTSIDAETIGILYEGSQADLIFQLIKVKELGL
jgi:sialidase-1